LVHSVQAWSCEGATHLPDLADNTGFRNGFVRRPSRVEDISVGFASTPPSRGAECSFALELPRIVADSPCSALPALGALAHAQALSFARLLTATPERPDGDDPNALLAMPEVARRLGVTEHQAREMGRRGDLPTVTVGERLVRVRAGALVEWIRRRESGRNIETRKGR